MCPPCALVSAGRYVTSDGFRTFVKGSRAGGLAGGGSSFAKEPFGPAAADRAGTTRDMFVGMNEVEVQEVDQERGLQTNALYFTLPGEKFNGLVRRATFTNLGDSELKLDVLDGQVRATH